MYVCEKGALSLASSCLYAVFQDRLSTASLWLPFLRFFFLLFLLFFLAAFSPPPPAEVRSASPPSTADGSSGSSTSRFLNGRGAG